MIASFILKGINYYIFKIVNNKGTKRFKKFNCLKTLQEYNYHNIRNEKLNFIYYKYN